MAKKRGEETKPVETKSATPKPAEPAAKEVKKPAAGESPQAALGQAIWVAMHSPTHRHLFLADLEWALIPPVRLRQIRFFGKDGAIDGFATWAMVNEEVEKRLLSGNRRLAPTDWRSGERAWLIDLIAPTENAAKAAIGEIKARAFADTPFNMLVPSKDGKGWVGVEVKLGDKPTEEKK
jgi:cytolysin-activating lysine-acyltransferase